MVHTPVAMKRIVRDVGQVMGPSKQTLASQGIYYLPDESCSYKGVALVIGQSDTPYFGGFYFFSILFPEDYPFTPIQVRTLTQDGKTRFNPNMYLDGKVCLSILNTWHDGPQWSGIQTLESVLLVLQSAVLVSNPLKNEPAFQTMELTPDSQTYNRLLWYANLETAILTMLTKPPAYVAGFEEILRSEFMKRKEDILKRAADDSVNDGKTETCRVFSMKSTYNFTRLIEQLLAVKN
jgi:ubiquitin-protein ligase